MQKQTTFSKLSLLLSLAFAGFFVFSACEDEAEEVINEVVPEISWTVSGGEGDINGDFSINATAVNYREDQDLTVFVVNPSNAPTVQFVFNGQPSEQTYNIGVSASIDSVNADNQSVYTLKPLTEQPGADSLYFFTAGTITFTEVGNNYAGNFSGEVVNTNRDTLQIQNGEFRNVPSL